MTGSEWGGEEEKRRLLLLLLRNTLWTKYCTRRLGSYIGASVGAVKSAPRAGSSEKAGFCTLGRWNGAGLLGKGQKKKTGGAVLSFGGYDGCGAAVVSVALQRAAATGASWTTGYGQ